MDYTIDTRDRSLYVAGIRVGWLRPKFSNSGAARLWDRIDYAYRIGQNSGQGYDLAVQREEQLTAYLSFDWRADSSPRVSLEQPPDELTLENNALVGPNGPVATIDLEPHGVRVSIPDPASLNDPAGLALLLLIETMRGGNFGIFAPKT